MRGIAVAVAVAAAAGVSNAQVIGGLITEMESNDTLATANYIGEFAFPGGSIAIDGNKGAGDVDWFEFDLAQASTLILAQVGTLPLNSDTQLMLVDSSGIVVAYNDDAIGLQSAFIIDQVAAGTYFIGVSGFPDIGFLGDPDPTGTDEIFDGLDGSGAVVDNEFDYKLSLAVNLVPAPGAVALAGLGGLVAMRRRR